MVHRKEEGFPPTLIRLRSVRGLANKAVELAPRCNSKREKALMRGE